MRNARLPWILFAAAATAFACGPGDDPPPIGNGGGGNGGGNGEPVSTAWETETLDEGGVGLQSRLTIGPGGRIAVAHWTVTGWSDGPCEELGIDDPPTRIRWGLRAALYDGGAWTTETVDEPILLGAPRGVDVAFAPDGRVVVAGPAGEPIQRVGSSYCGANDLALFWRDGAGSWSVQTAVSTSDQAASQDPDPSMRQASDSGDVVGYWPSMTFHPGSGEVLVAYQDRHFGGLQSDDRDRADLELVWGSGGGFRHLPVDMAQGAGFWTDLSFDSAGHPVILYYVPDTKLLEDRRGLWVARSTDEGESWTRVQFHVGRTAERPTMAFQPQTGRLVIAYYDGLRGQPFVAHVDPGASFEDAIDDGWHIERIGDARFDEGYGPSVAVAPDGRIGVAYYRCTRSDRDFGDCSPGQDALIFAWQDEGGDWTREVVDPGRRGICGTYPTLGFTSSGEAVIAYQCVVEHDDGGDDPAFEHRLKFARREALP